VKEAAEIMKYYIMEMDERNKCPYNINSNQGVDVRLLSREQLKDIPAWSVVGMTLPDEGFFPDLICSPWIMMSESCARAVMAYQPDIQIREMELLDREREINRIYCFILLDKVDCLSDKTEYNSIGNRILRPVLDREKIGGRVIFRVAGYERKCVVGRMDLVESLLRRGAAGIRLEETEVV